MITLALPRALTWPAVRSIPLSHIAAAAIPVLAFAAYWLIGPNDPGTNVYIPLADALMHGRLSIEPRSWMELVAVGDGSGQMFVPFPPVPAIFYVPVVAVMGSLPWNQELPSNAVAAILGAVSVVLAYWMLVGWRVTMAPRLWLTAAYAIAIVWVAGTAGHHFEGQVSGLLFSFAALDLAVRRRWPIAAGLLLGLAAGSRLPMGLALPVLLVLYGWRPRWSHAQLLAGLAVPALLLAAYNIARFGSPLEFGYGLIVYGDPPVSVLSNSKYADGILSLAYIPRNLVQMFLTGFQPDWYNAPWAKPDLRGLSLVFAAPWLLWAVAARGRLAAVLGVTVVLVLLPDLMHGNPGYTQVGYRFVLDAMPLLLLLLGQAYHDRMPAAVKVGIVVSGLVMLYAAMAVYGLGFYFQPGYHQ